MDRNARTEADQEAILTLVEPMALLGHQEATFGTLSARQRLWA